MNFIDTNIVRVTYKFLYTKKYHIIVDSLGPRDFGFLENPAPILWNLQLDNRNDLLTFFRFKFNIIPATTILMYKFISNASSNLDSLLEIIVREIIRRGYNLKKYSGSPPKSYPIPQTYGQNTIFAISISYIQRIKLQANHSSIRQ